MSHNLALWSEAHQKTFQSPIVGPDYWIRSSHVLFSSIVRNCLIYFVCRKYCNFVRWHFAVSRHVPVSFHSRLILRFCIIICGTRRKGVPLAQTINVGCFCGFFACRGFLGCFMGESLEFGYIR